MAIDLTGGLGEELEYVFADRPDNPKMRESVNAWIWDNGVQFGLPRIGVEAVADNWDTSRSSSECGLRRRQGIQCLVPATGARTPWRRREATPPRRRSPLVRARRAVRTPANASPRRSLGNLGRGPDQRQFPGHGDPVPIEIDVELRPAAPPWMNGALLADAERRPRHARGGRPHGTPLAFRAAVPRQRANAYR